MMEGWKKVALKDAVEFSPRESLAKGQTAKKVAMEKLQPFSRAIPSYEVESYNGGAKFRNGDVLMARITPCLENGKTSRVDMLDDNEIGFGSTEFIVLRAYSQVTEPDYVYYLATSPFIRDIAIKSMVGSSGRQRVQEDVLKSTVINLPPLPAQRAIAATLSCLDDKIKLNNRVNANLEAQAQAIFKSWFVDFEPFQDGEFAESELGRIPKGWKVGVLSELVKVKYGKDHKKLNDGDIPVYGSGGLMRLVDTALFSGESVLIPRKGTLNNVMYVNEAFWTVDTMFFTEMRKVNIAKYIYHFIKGQDLASMNAGSAVPSMTTDILNTLPIIIPSENALLIFNGVVSPLYHTVQSLKKENATLTSIRDALLPKLMSGEIEVPLED